MIAAQNMVVAAESLGMGTVYLGSILNDNAKLSELLKLPKYVYPAVGLAVGWPDQEPQLKPRLPRHVIHMENYYKDLENPLAELKTTTLKSMSIMIFAISITELMNLRLKLPRPWTNPLPIVLTP